MSFIAYYAETFNSLDIQTSLFLGTLYVCLLISIFQLGFYVYKRSQFTHMYLMQILHFNSSVCLFLCCFSFFFFFYKIQIKKVEQVSCRYNFDCHYTDHLLSIKTLLRITHVHYSTSQMYARSVYLLFPENWKSIP